MFQMSPLALASVSVTGSTNPSRKRGRGIKDIVVEQRGEGKM